MSSTFHWIRGILANPFLKWRAFLWFSSLLLRSLRLPLLCARVKQ
jgi:hypothetical protein